MHTRWRCLPLVTVMACSSTHEPAPQDATAQTITDTAVQTATDATLPTVTDSSTVTTPCTGPAACLARLTIPGSTWQIPYYSTFPIDQAVAQVQRVVVFNQGLNRDADTDFTTMVTAARMAGVLDSTLVVTPHFEALVGTTGAPCTGHTDTPAPNDLLWTCDAWSDGLSATNASTTSYGALDAVLRTIEATYPTLQRITVAGFSAGGQLTQRYIAVNTVDTSAHGTAFRYVVGSPSSYLYFDTQRPTNASTCTTTGCPDGFVTYTGSTSCPTFNDWKYGTDALVGAAASLTPTALESAYLGRDVTYLLGALDNGPTTTADYAQLDTTCPAEAQGPYRLQRGLAFHAYATHLGALPSTVSVVAGCGHDTSCVYDSAEGIAAVFGP